MQTLKVGIKKFGKKGQGQGEDTKSTKKHIIMTHITIGVKLTIKHSLFKLESLFGKRWTDVGGKQTYCKNNKRKKMMSIRYKKK